MVDTSKTQEFVNQYWDKEVLETLVDYIKIPNKSPEYDPDWESNGFMEEALQLAVQWLKEHAIPGAELHIGRIPTRTPSIVLDIPGQYDKTVLMYGHFDKQPEMEGWRDDLGPWKPVIEGDKLYGRGGADDGYALFSCVTAIKALQEQGIKHPRIVVFIEFSEESGSRDVVAHLEHFEDLIGRPDFLVCLDSCVGDYERLWMSTSLRGLARGTLDVQVLNEGIHSGEGTGIVASSFRVMRSVLDRIENSVTGEIFTSEMKVDIPEKRLQQARQMADIVQADFYNRMPWVDGMTPLTDDVYELILNNTWRSGLAYVGIDGVPSCQDGGNVLRPYTKLKMAFRLPPTLDAKAAGEHIQKVLTENPPYGAKVTVDIHATANGWNALDLPQELETVCEEASKAFYGQSYANMGIGGSIPFLGLLAKKFPGVPFVVTGVLGPKSNAHGPNEFLHLPYVKKLTACMAYILGRYPF